MKRYRSHKIVEAAKVTDLNYDKQRGFYLTLEGGEEVEVSTRWMQKNVAVQEGGRIASIHRPHPLIGGYFVRYPDSDGYTSWSPADVFERGNTSIEELQHVGIERVAAERKRQVQAEGYSLEHDDEHISGELSAAAACYAEVASRLEMSDDDPEELELGTIPKHWPWDWDAWKPSANPVRNLEKAGALIVAEIDRLLRRRKA